MKPDALAAQNTMLLEVWQFEEDGMSLSSLEYAGPLGEPARALLPAGARLVATRWASCHYEAMTIYNRMMGYEPYTTDQPSDYEPYPKEWIEQQRATGIVPPAP